MLTDTNATMIEALRLTQAGQLTEASSLLQRDLGGAPGGGLQGAMADLPGIGSTGLPGRAPSSRSGAAARAAAAPGGGIPPPHPRVEAGARRHHPYNPTGSTRDPVPPLLLPPR